MFLSLKKKVNIFLLFFISTLVILVYQVEIRNFALVTYWNIYLIFFLFQLTFISSDENVFLMFLILVSI